MADYSVDRRSFLGSIGAGTLGAVAVGGIAATAVAEGPDAKILGDAGVATSERSKKVWEPISDRKVRVGIVGHGVCRWGSQFGFQNHPNVEVVAVSDLFSDRCNELAKACRCEKTFESLEALVKDPQIEAVYVATDAPSHTKHSIEALKHGKHVACAVPAAFGSLEDAEKLLEAVKASGQKYIMYETSAYRPDCYAMRQIYQAGGFGKLVYSEGEYFHHRAEALPSYKEWRLGIPPMWYPTHSTAYYIHVTNERFTTVSCVGFRNGAKELAPNANRYGNTFSDEIALFQTSEGGSSRMAVSWGVQGHHSESGRVFGEAGSMIGVEYKGTAKSLPNLERPPLPPKVSTGGHGGSHGNLTNEFITAILEDRAPVIDIYQSLAMTVPGIVAHQSALKDGELLRIPLYQRPANS